ncbi:contact-dependent growth inhibition system immunity protein [Pseudescherichia sp.]|uniref:contact-dependent growth inhibition system immunity protein n=1 Tax=Pseudescherichia sp. TaxID=2055881 RepID=UPI00289B1F1E|nr:contact-dependent growth inhibition system immunity protein [Pseudescherichia sp.]
MLLTTNLDIMIEGTLNQDFDYITGAESIDDAIDIYTSELAANDRADLKKEVLAFLACDEKTIESEFRTRYINSFAPEEGKGLLLRILEGIKNAEKP